MFCYSKSDNKSSINLNRDNWKMSKTETGLAPYLYQFLLQELSETSTSVFSDLNCYFFIFNRLTNPCVVFLVKSWTTVPSSRTITLARVEKKDSSGTSKWMIQLYSVLDTSLVKIMLASSRVRATFLQPFRTCSQFNQNFTSSFLTKSNCK